MGALPEEISIGELAERSGVATSALRFYEDKGLLCSRRTAGNQRRYPRAMLRRVSVIRAGQQLGLPLSEIGLALDALPSNRTPSRRDWERMSRSWRQQLDDRIAALERLRDTLDGCIGCGCLSLDTCSLFNVDDAVARHGAGPRILMGDPATVPPGE